MTWELFSGQCEVDAEGRQQSDIQREAASLQNKISQFWDDWGHGHRLWVNFSCSQTEVTNEAVFFCDVFV